MDPAASLTPLLIDAKREYVSQLTDVLAPYVINRFVNMYIAAVRDDKRTAVQTFQRALKGVPQWNAQVTNALAGEVQSKYSFLGDLIAACFVAHVKVLSSVKLHHQKPHIRLKLPANDTFVHKVYVHTAREFYSNPKLVHADRGVKVDVVRGAVEAAVRDMLPIEDILKAYLGNTVDADQNSLKSEEMYEPQPVVPPPPPPPPLPPPAAALPQTLSFGGGPSPQQAAAAAVAADEYGPDSGDDDGGGGGQESDDEPKQITFADAPGGMMPPQPPPHAAVPHHHHQRPAPAAGYPSPPPSRPRSTADDLFSDAEDDF